MRVLLSGAHGLVGGALTAALRGDGVEVVILARPQAPDDAGSAAVPWDPGQGHVDHRALDAQGPYDAVVHLAGAGIGDRRWSPARRHQILDSRTRPTRLLAEAVAAMSPPPSAFVCASAVGYYGDRGAEILTEESHRGAGFLAEVSAAWEEAASPAAAATRVVNLRSGIVLAPHGGALGRQLPLFRLGLGGRLGSGQQYVSWISLADEVAVVRRAIDDGRLAGPVNAVAPAPVTNAELTRALGRALGRPTLLAVPAPLLAVAFGREMAGELLLASQRVHPARLAAGGHRFVHPDIDQALAWVLAHGS